MKIYNPTDSKITVQIKGVEYTIGAQEELSGVPQDHAEHWKVYIHEFLELSEEKDESDITLKSFEPRDDVDEVEVAKPTATTKTTKKATTKKSK